MVVHTVDINRFVLVGDKEFESRWELVKSFANANVLNGFFEFFIADLAILIANCVIMCVD